MAKKGVAVVTFKEDYSLKREHKGKIRERVMYKKDETHTMHTDLAHKLQEAGAQFDVEYK